MQWRLQTEKYHSTNTHRHPDFPPRLSASMGKKNKTLKGLTGEGSLNIGDLLLQRPCPNMAAQPDHGSSTSSEADPLDVPDAIPDTGCLNTHLPTAELNTRATNGDILELMRNMRRLFNADLAVVREEIMAITARVQATEGEISAIAHRQTGTAEQQAQLHTSQQTLSHQLDALDDYGRRKNVKLRGIAEAIGDSELLHIVQQMLASNLPQ
ncbi:Hypothetical predicted protein [Pelobates cultripes]|uniref:Uncharacterized protein n=1 Tax=Pelobates cultripes TaxID=61616 RepID=A0AAD1RBU9_PELCU|nr:Hypothetical predicted protein [Pelobates cultripes]